MSLISNLIAQHRAVIARHNGNAQTFAGRDQLLGAANKPVGPLKQLQQDEVNFTGKIHQGNFNSKYAARWEMSAREKMKEDIKSTFSTFA